MGDGEALGVGGRAARPGRSALWRAGVWACARGCGAGRRAWEGVKGGLLEEWGASGRAVVRPRSYDHYDGKVTTAGDGVTILTMRWPPGVPTCRAVGCQLALRRSTSNTHHAGLWPLVAYVHGELDFHGHLVCFVKVRCYTVSPQYF